MRSGSSRSWPQRGASHLSVCVQLSATTCAAKRRAVGRALQRRVVVGYSGVLQHPGTGRTTRTISSFWPEPSASSSVAAVAMPKKSAPNVRVGSAFIDLPLSANAEGSERPNLHKGTDSRNKGTDNRNKAIDNCIRVPIAETRVPITGIRLLIIV